MTNQPGSQILMTMIFEIVGKHMGVPPASLAATDDIIRDLGADSLDKMELIMTIEELFGIRITAKRLASVTQVSDLWEAVGEASLSPARYKQVQNAWNRISPRASHKEG